MQGGIIFPDPVLGIGKKLLTWHEIRAVRQQKNYHSPSRVNCIDNCLTVVDRGVICGKETDQNYNYPDKSDNVIKGDECRVDYKFCIKQLIQGYVTPNRALRNVPFTFSSVNKPQTSAQITFRA